MPAPEYNSDRTQKRCYVCKTFKDVDDFYRHCKAGAASGFRLNMCKECSTLRADIWRDANRERWNRGRHFKSNAKRLGISRELFMDLMQSTPNCPGCGIKAGETKRSFTVDHCHLTGRIRGMLCTECNLLVGVAADNPNRLRNLARYLERELRKATTVLHAKANTKGDGKHEST